VRNRRLRGPASVSSRRCGDFRPRRSWTSCGRAVTPPESGGRIPFKWYHGHPRCSRRRCSGAWSDLEEARTGSRSYPGDRAEVSGPYVVRHPAESGVGPRCINSAGLRVRTATSSASSDLTRRAAQPSAQSHTARPDGTRRGAAAPLTPPPGNVAEATRAHDRDSKRSWVPPHRQTARRYRCDEYGEVLSSRSARASKQTIARRPAGSMCRARGATVASAIVGGGRPGRERRAPGRAYGSAGS
jgi:hypothetical protein